MERYLFVLIILFITVGLFIVTTTKIKCEKFNTSEREKKMLNRNIDYINKSLKDITNFETTLLNII